MALITTIKRCLGFGVTDDEEDYEALAADALHAGIATPPFHEPAPEKQSESEDAEPKTNDEVEETADEQSAPPSSPSRLTELLIDIVRTSIASPRFAAELERLTGPAHEERYNDRARLLEEIRRLKEQNGSTAMLTNELNSLRLSSQRQQRAYTERINELTEILNRSNKTTTASDLPDPLIADLQQQLTSREATIASLNETISTLNMKIAMADEMVNTLNKKASEARVALQEATNQYEARIEKLEGELADSQSMNQALTDRLQQIASEQTGEAATSETPKPEKKRRGRKKKSTTEAQPETLPAVNAIDTSLEDTSWLVAEPPAEMTVNKETKKPGEFGYTEPQHRDGNFVDDRQMSLW